MDSGAAARSTPSGRRPFSATAQPGPLQPKVSVALPARPLVSPVVLPLLKATAKRHPEVQSPVQAPLRAPVQAPVQNPVEAPPRARLEPVVEAGAESVQRGTRAGRAARCGRVGVDDERETIARGRSGRERGPVAVAIGDGFRRIGADAERCMQRPVRARRARAKGASIAADGGAGGASDPDAAERADGRLRANALAARRRARLDGMIELARRYRGWTRNSLGERLGRDPGKLIPDSGVPRLDLVASLARMLDWPIGDLAEAIWIDGPELDAIEACATSTAREQPTASVASADATMTPEADRANPSVRGGQRARPALLLPAAESHGHPHAADGVRAGRGALAASRWDLTAVPQASFAELDLLACNAHRRGDPGALYRIAGAMAAAARSADERAIAANREAGAWDLRGRYSESIRAIRRGLEEASLRSDIRLTLEANLANAHYAIWHLVEAHAVATRLIDRFRQEPPRTRLERVIAAFVHYVRGNAARRGIAEASAFELGPERSDPSSRLEVPGGFADRTRAHAAERAVRDLERALEDYRRLHAEFGDPSYDAIASTCRGGIVECRVELGDMAAGEAMELILDLLADVADVATHPADDRLESFGWWAIFGCNIALRHLEGAFFHRAMAICTNKAAEIAERLDHWGIRERVFTIEHVQQRRRTAAVRRVLRPVSAAAGCDARDGETPVDGGAPVWLLDTDDLRILAGTMGRFPGFRETGWRILSSARISDED